MSKKLKKKAVIIDIEGALELLDKRGKYYSKNGVSRNHNITTVTLRNYQIKAPEVVRFIFNLCNETGLTFEELVKEI